MKALGRGLLQRLNINPYKLKIMNTPSPAEMPKQPLEPDSTGTTSGVAAAWAGFGSAWYQSHCKRCGSGKPILHVATNKQYYVECCNCGSETSHYDQAVNAREAWTLDRFVYARAPAYSATLTEAPKPTSSINLLEQARSIQEQRAKDYDQPGGERSMEATVKAFNIITRRTGDLALTESEGWLLMQVLKDVRDRSTKKPHRDSLEDGISYSSLKAEARLKEI